MLHLIRNAECFSPDHLGKVDVLVGGTKILRIASNISITGNVAVRQVDASGKWLIPGLVDSLVHITGGGGEGGFTSRTPEVQLSALFKAGITTLVGALGTDSVTRTLSNLIAKARELSLGGVQSFCYTGSYHIPVKTLTGSVEGDIIYLPEFIGVGELAISDHRSSQPSLNTLASVAAEARVAGMISGKAGIVSIHVGDGKQGLSPLIDLCDKTDLPLTQFYPTHINRNPRLFDQGIEYAKQGGLVDLTTSTTAEILASGEIACHVGLAKMLNAGVPIERITFSSDGNASLPLFDKHGHLSGMQVGQVSSLWQEIRSAIIESKIEPSVALRVATQNPADILGLPTKGRIQERFDADLLLVDGKTLAIESVMTQGEWRIFEDNLLQTGPFE